MRITIFSLATLVALIGCNTNRPATPAPTAQPIGTPERVQPPPVHALLGFREELELTSQQIEAIDSIGQWLFSAGDELRARLRETQATTGPRRDPRGTEQAIETLTGIQNRNRTAIEGVQELLTDEQEAKVCELFREDRPRTDSRAQPVRRQRGQGAYPSGPLPPIWTWCARADGPAETGETG